MIIIEYQNCILDCGSDKTSKLNLVLWNCDGHFFSHHLSLCSYQMFVVTLFTVHII